MDEDYLEMIVEKLYKLFQDNQSQVNKTTTEKLKIDKRKRKTHANMMQTLITVVYMILIFISNL